MIGAPNTRGQKYLLDTDQWATGISDSNEIADIFHNYDSDIIHIRLLDSVTHPCPNSNGGLVNPPLRSGYVWVITSNTKQWRFIHALKEFNKKNPFLSLALDMK